MKLPYIYHLVIIICPMVLTAGCVSSQVRKGADRLAAFTFQVSEEGTDFVRSRTMVAQARQANIAMLEVNAVELDTAVSRDIEVWRLAGETGKQRVALFEGIRSYANTAATKSVEMADLRKRYDDSIASAKSAVNLRQAELSKVSEALASLAQEPDLESELVFFAAYFKEVSTGIQKAKEEADQRVKEAEVATKRAVPLDGEIPQSN